MATISRLTESSPTANLLRNSRLFSLPQRLPQPDMASKGRAFYKNSPSATTSYPTHQVIVTPQSSRHRGDWGLKRPLPMKSTAKSFGIKMDVLDTYDQVTEFEPAHAHVKTLKKLQELHIHLTRPPRRPSDRDLALPPNSRPNPSAFEPKYDNTAPMPKTLEEVKRERTDFEKFMSPTRWRQRGPDLRQLPQTEFDAYLTQRVEKERHSFSNFLKAHYTKQQAASKLASEQDGSLEALFLMWLKSLNHVELEAYLLRNAPEWFTTEELSAELGEKPWMPPKPVTAPSFEAMLCLIDNNLLPPEFRASPEELSLVHDPASSSAQWEKIGQLVKESPKITPQLATEVQRVEATFLASIQPTWPQYLLAFRITSATKDEPRELIEYFFDIPQSIPDGKNDMLQLSTHPSAGLSYRRTAHTLYNHPIFGPTAGREPQRGRVLPNSPSANRQDGIAKMHNRYEPPMIAVGLAGLVVSHNGKFQSSSPSLLMTPKGDGSHFTRGTDKEYVKVTQAHVNHLGRLNMQVTQLEQAFQEMASNTFDLPGAMKRARLPGRPLSRPQEDDAVREMANPLDEKDDYKLARAKPFQPPSSGASSFRSY